MTDVEFEDDTSYETERPLLVCKGNYDLELGLALSESLNPSDTLLATNPQGSLVTPMNSQNQKYIVEITKKLESFKNAKEWSDFISLLASLDSTIKSYALPYIPKKELLSKRLEQCLNPLLPAGVHNKALETFSIVFETISRKELEDNFGVYTLGLFTFASHSRLLVINHYLDVIEKHIIPFGESISIYTPNVLMGLLPPLESRSNEFYNRASLILNNFKSNIEDSVFYISIWNIFLTDPSMRLSIVNYLLDGPIDIEKMAKDKVLVIRALCKGLTSKEALVIRGTLDLISIMFPLNTNILENEFKYDLLESMLRIFLRRDLSLNKRVFAWMGYQNNADNQNIRLIKNTLVRYLSNEKDLLVFFKIFITLSSKSRLSEQVLESLLFKVLFQIKKYSNLKSEDELEISKEASDIQSFSKSFLSEDLDVLWKIFYLKLMSSISSNQDTEISIDSVNKSNLKNITVEGGMKEGCGTVNVESGVLEVDPEIVQISEIGMKEGDGTVNVESGVLEVDPEIVQISEIGMKEGGGTVNVESGVLEVDPEIVQISEIGMKEGGGTVNVESGVLEVDPEIVQISESVSVIPEPEPNEVQDVLSAEESRDFCCEMTSSDLLQYIDFCCENYNVFDDNVSSTHLPILIMLILRHRESFDRKVLLDFLKHNIKRIKLIEQSNEVNPIIFRKIDKFYREEDVTTLLDIKGGFAKCLIDFLQVLISEDIENTHSFYIDFIVNHRQEFEFDEYIKKYYEVMLTATLKTIGNSLRLFNYFGTTYIKCEKLFIELWERFCKQRDIHNQDMMAFNQPKWDISVASEASSVSKGHSGFYRSVANLPESIYDKKDQRFNKAEEENCDYDYEKKAMDKKYIVILIYDFNMIFKQKFEKYLLRKVSEDAKHNICLFIHYLFELEGNKEYYFYNLFFIINNKISGRDPVITALIKSLVNFEDAFMFIIKKFESSSILSKNFVYIDEPNLNQIKGIVKCLKNMVTYSRRFRVMLKTSEIKYSSELFENKKEFKAKTFVYKILKYIFLCEIDTSDNRLEDLRHDMSALEIKNKAKSRQTAGTLNREIKIDCIKLIMNLVVLKVLDRNDVVDDDLPAILRLLQVYRLDPAIILPSSVLIRAAGKQNFLSEFATILDSKCFYYYDFLEFLFQLPVNQKKMILCSIIASLGKDNYALMIKYEIIKEIIGIEDSSLNWSSIVQQLIRDNIDFYNEDLSAIYIADNVTDRRSSAELLFNDSVNQSFTREHNQQFVTYNSHTMNIKIKAIIRTASLIYSKLSGYFIEYLISLPFPKKFVKDLEFKVSLFSNILLSSTSNYERLFSFMLEFDDILTNEERQEAFKASKQTLFQIINYRTETYPSTLLFLLTVFSRQRSNSEDVSSFLTVIYQAIAYIQKNLDNRKGVDHRAFMKYSKILNLLSNIEYTEKIRSAHQTYTGFLIELVKNHDTVVSTCALEQILILSNNKSVTESMWAKEFMEYFNQPTFFSLNIEQKSLLVGRVANYKVEVIDDLIVRLNSSFFVSQASDISTKCTVLQRMAFLIFSAPYDRYSSFNIQLIEIIPNLIQHSSNKIRKNVLFLIRVMLYKIEHNRLSTIFPILFSELLAILGRICDEDNEVIVEAFKVIDIIFLLNTEQVIEFRNNLSNIVSILDEDIPEDELETETNVPLFRKTFIKLKKRFDIEIDYVLDLKANRGLFFTTKFPTMNDIGKFLKYSAIFYSQQDKSCLDFRREEIDSYIMEEFKN